MSARIKAPVPAQAGASPSRIEIIRKAALKAGNAVCGPDSAPAAVKTGVKTGTPAPPAAPALRIPRHMEAPCASSSLPDSRRVHRLLPNFCFVRY